MPAAGWVVLALTLVCVPLALLAGLVARARVRYTRRLPSFRCCAGRVGGKAGLRWTSGAWVSDVLLVRTGLRGLWLTPLVPVLGSQEGLRPVLPEGVRGLGSRPVGLMLEAPDGLWLVVVRGGDADELIGPFLTAALSWLPEAPRERGV